jgi:hypothetical protein
MNFHRETIWWVMPVDLVLGHNTVSEQFNAIDLTAVVDGWE